MIFHNSHTASIQATWTHEMFHPRWALAQWQLSRHLGVEKTRGVMGSRVVNHGESKQGSCHAVCHAGHRFVRHFVPFLLTELNGKCKYQYKTSTAIFRFGRCWLHLSHCLPRCWWFNLAFNPKIPPKNVFKQTLESLPQKIFQVIHDIQVEKQTPQVC